MKINQSARKHGIADEDMLHALRYATVEWPIREGFTILSGPSRAGNFLEIGVANIDDDDAEIVHAMRCRRQYLPRI